MQHGCRAKPLHLENENHEAQYSTVLDWVATLNTSHAQNVVTSENVALQSDDSWVHSLLKMYIPITSFFMLFLMLVLRIWFFKVVNLKYILCSKSIISLLVREFGSSRWQLLSTSSAQNLHLITRFLQFSLISNSENWVPQQYLWFIFSLDFDHSCIETVKINESR